jgi:hypothetical protein
MAWISYTTRMENCVLRIVQSLVLMKDHFLKIIKMGIRSKDVTTIREIYMGYAANTMNREF